jgi:prepilin-type N-terminal cleavage/methylation domain-containing protein
MDSPHRFAGKGKSAFTLIELLIVILIIAILIGLLMPAASYALNMAKKTAAKNQAVQIATAITSYEAEYGRFPSNSTNTFNAGLVTILCTTNDSTNNPRGLIFLEAGSWKTGKGGTNASGFCDPFSSSNVYRVAMDTNYANSITVSNQATAGGAITSTNITKRVGVWTIWVNGRQTNLINSWD